MKRRLIVLGGACAVVVGGVLYLFLSSHDSEVLVAPAASLTAEWTTLRPSSSMRTTGDMSRLYVEILDVHEGPPGTYSFKDGSRLYLEGYLVSRSGEKVNLEGYAVGFGGKPFLCMSNPVLEWKRRDYSFRTVSLRADRALRVGRIVWVSYDPQSTKTGVKIPDAFLKD